MRWCREVWGGEGESGLIKNNVPRYDNFIGGKVEVTVVMVVRGELRNIYFVEHGVNLYGVVAVRFG